jgi:hypothetical protein
MPPLSLAHPLPLALFVPLLINFVTSNLTQKLVHVLRERERERERERMSNAWLGGEIHAPAFIV